MKTFKQLFAEGAKSDTKNDGAEYKAFFAAALKKFGVSSPGELKGDDEKKFYDYIDANWEADDEQDESWHSGSKKKKMKEGEQDEEMSMYQKYVKGKKKKEDVSQDEEMSMYQKYGKGKKKKEDVEEAKSGAQANWVVTVKQNHNGLKAKDSVQVVAQNTSGALKKAAKKLGVPDAWKHTGVLDVKKEDV